MATPSLLELPDEILGRIVRLLDLHTTIFGTRLTCSRLRRLSLRFGKKIELDLNSEDQDFIIREGKTRPNRAGLTYFTTRSVDDAREFIQNLPKFFEFSYVTLKLSSVSLDPASPHITTEDLCRLARNYRTFFHVEALTIHGGLSTMDDDLFDQLKSAITTFSRIKLKYFVLLANFSSRHLRYLLDLLLANGIHLSSFFTLLENKADLRYLLDYILRHNSTVISKEFALYVKVEDIIGSDDLERMLHEFTKEVATHPILLKSGYFTSEQQTNHERLLSYRPGEQFYQTAVNRNIGYKIDVTKAKEAFIIIPSQQFPCLSVQLSAINDATGVAPRNFLIITAQKDIIVKISFEPLDVDFRTKTYRIPKCEHVQIYFDMVSRSGYIDYELFPDFMKTQRMVITYSECGTDPNSLFPVQEKWLEFDGREDPRLVNELEEELPFTLAIT
ncbi:hypothetical protein QR680_006169 [Steinernema hermaphroditum]|uniref:F-box domain-containing protein n=1 Tax=Steinernema hermaphroditum TaxID=289476 RepID=A0AA39HVY9_9BILA|nr:hypothetical protein QR680_006169 [Steinernema hermaphroditum]